MISDFHYGLPHWQQDKTIDSQMKCLSVSVFPVWLRFPVAFPETLHKLIHLARWIIYFCWYLSVYGDYTDIQIDTRVLPLPPSTPDTPQKGCNELSACQTTALPAPVDPVACDLYYLDGDDNDLVESAST